MDMSKNILLISSKLFEPESRIPNVEITVVQKPNQGTSPKWGCNPFRVSFLVLFGQAKRTTPAETLIKTNATFAKLS